MRLAKKLSLAAFVIAVAFRAHALRQTIESDELSKLFAGVLAATIRVKEGRLPRGKLDMALARALVTRTVCMVSATLHPTTARL